MYPRSGGRRPAPGQGAHAPRTRDEAVGRRVTEGRALATIATGKRPMTFSQILGALAGVGKRDLTAALDQLVARGLVEEINVPSHSAPLFDPPTIRYAAVGLQAASTMTEGGRS